MSNILKAILNIAQNTAVKITDDSLGSNRINNMGDALETYIQDAFANTLGESNPQIRTQKVSDTFSYLGNASNPPDIILKNSEAIEVKKIQSKGAAIALNSSSPKQKLFSNDSRITQACKECETWTEKDIIYAIGVVKEKKLNHLWLIYGDCYAAENQVYSRISKTIKDGILAISGVEFAKTNELSRINKVDPLGITNLRVRGMWHIDNPLKVFEDVYVADDSNYFNLSCIMRSDKFNSFCREDKKAIEDSDNISMSNIKIKNPDNPAQLLDSKLITIRVKS